MDGRKEVSRKNLKIPYGSNYSELLCIQNIKIWITIRFGISKWVMATINYDNPMGSNGLKCPRFGQDHAWMALGFLGFPGFNPSRLQERNASGFLWFHHVLHWLEVCPRCSLFERDNLRSTWVTWGSCPAKFVESVTDIPRAPVWICFVSPGWSHPSCSCLWLPTERDMPQKNRARWAWKAERWQMYTK